MATRNSDLFSSLPPELRLEIYEHIWDQPVEVEVAWEARVGPCPIVEVSSSQHTAILRTSQHINTEAAPVFTRQIILVLGTYWAYDELYAEVFRYSSLHRINTNYMQIPSMFGRVELKINVQDCYEQWQYGKHEILFDPIWRGLKSMCKRANVRRIDKLKILYTGCKACSGDLPVASWFGGFHIGTGIQCIGEVAVYCIFDAFNKYGDFVSRRPDQTEALREVLNVSNKQERKGRRPYRGIRPARESF